MSSRLLLYNMAAVTYRSVVPCPKSAADQRRGSKAGREREALLEMLAPGIVDSDPLVRFGKQAATTQNPQTYTNTFKRSN